MKRTHLQEGRSTLHCGVHRPSRNQAEGLHHPPRVRHFGLEDIVIGQRTGFELPNPLRAVYEQKFLVAYRGGLDEGMCCNYDFSAVCIWYDIAERPVNKGFQVKQTGLILFG